MAGAAGLALAAALAAGDVPLAAGAIGGSGAVVLTLGVAGRFGAAVTVGLALLGAGYAVSLIGRDIAPGAGLVAAALLVVAELAYWSVEPVSPGFSDPIILRRRLALIGALFVGTVLVGTLLLDIASAAVGGDRLLGVAGALAAVALLAVVVSLLHRLRRPPPVR